MGALLSLPITLLNFLLPFTRPGTPLTQDLIHTAVLCGTLYFAPQIAEWYNSRHAQEQLQQEHTLNPSIAAGEEETQQDDEPPIDDRFILQDDGEEGGETIGQPPPLAPTPPPPGQQSNQRHAPPPEVEDFIEPEPMHNHNDAQPQPGIGVPGPANDRPRATPANRVIGAKKAKSLARKDQRRAYHEFHRQEAEMRRLQEQEGAEERETALAAERERRAQVEEQIREKEREEREKRKEEERREAEQEVERREKVIERCREEVRLRGAVDLVDIAWTEGKDKIWIERLVRASGLLTQLQEDGAHVMITGHGWLVKANRELLEKAYADAAVRGSANGGKISITEFGSILEKAVLARTER